MRVVFFGTPGFSLPPLEALVSSGAEVAAVFTQPDRPAGRGRKLTPSPVKVRALERGFEVFQPERVRAADIASFSPDVAVVVAYGQYLSGKLLAVPPLGGVNIHPSLLPRWRGAAPLQRAIMAGDRETGVSIMKIDAGLDTGPVLMREKIALTDRTTAPDLHDALSEMGARLMVEALAGVRSIFG